MRGPPVFDTARRKTYSRGFIRLYMPVASPITRQTVGATFSVALAVLGLGVVAQMGGVGWAFATRFQMAKKEAAAGDLPLFARLTAPVGMRPDFSSDPFSTMMEEPLPTSGELRPPGFPPRPGPVPVGSPKAVETVPQTRFDELILQGKQLRERGDTGNALTKFREAGAMDPRNPIAIAELAATFDRMRLPERAAEQWKRIYEMGDTAGIYFSLAESKLKETRTRAILETAPQPAPTAATPVEGIAPGLLVGLGRVRSEDRSDAASLKRFTLLIPIKARPQSKIEVRDLVIHVLFYDKLDGKNVVQTSANVNSKWVTSPADWTDTDTEELAVEYQLPRPEAGQTKREVREFFGYIVRVYYKQQLQAATAEPERLAEQYPAPPILKTNEL